MQQKKKQRKEKGKTAEQRYKERNSRHFWKEDEKESEERQRETANEEKKRKYDQGKPTKHGLDKETIPPVKNQQNHARTEREKNEEED